MTKKGADINYISRDLFPKTYNRTMIDVDYIKQLEEQNKRYKEKIAYLERSNERKEETIIDYQINEYPVLEKLKNWLEEKIRYYKEIGYVNTSLALTMSLDKIKELEEGKK